jgi:hypothetical protein
MNPCALLKPFIQWTSTPISRWQKPGSTTAASIEQVDYWIGQLTHPLIVSALAVICAVSIFRCVSTPPGRIRPDIGGSKPIWVSFYAFWSGFVYKCVSGREQGIPLYARDPYIWKPGFLLMDTKHQNSNKQTTVYLSAPIHRTLTPIHI